MWKKKIILSFSFGCGWLNCMQLQHRSLSGKSAVISEGGNHDNCDKIKNKSGTNDDCENSQVNKNKKHSPFKMASKYYKVSSPHKY